MDSRGKALSAVRAGVLISLLVFVPLVQSQTATPTWTQLSLVGSLPQGRYAHTAVYDPVNNRLIVFGGQAIINMLNDIWVLSNANGQGGTSSWTQLAPTGGPSVRAFHSAVYDPASNRMIVFGGQTTYGAFVANDVWVLSNANGLGGIPVWTQLATVGLPPSMRLGHSAVYDPASNGMIVFGGETDSIQATTTNDVWMLSNANGLGGIPTWTRLLPTGALPTPRDLHSAVYDSTTNRMIVFGGFVNLTFANDIWVLSNANGLSGTPAWTQLTASGGPSGRYSHSAVYDPISKRMTVFGGFANFTLAKDLWVLSNANGLGGAPAWTELTVSGGPSGRYSHSAAYHQATNRMIVFGGFTSSGRANDVWVLSQGAAEITTVEILIKPREDDRPAEIDMEPGDETVIPVAILSNQTFDALAMVDWNSLTFGRTGDEASLMYCNSEDWRGVGTADLVCYFSAEKTGFQPGDTIGILKGKTLRGTPFRGTDSIRIEH